MNFYYQCHDDSANKVNPDAFFFLFYLTFISLCGKNKFLLLCGDDAKKGTEVYYEC